ncbi:MAG TPA: SRPBCC family protein [Blastocatellia bacterium]|nr:SRPBCC family protein [Blastocatellia bacterium]
MGRLELTRIIDAPIGVVFRTVADISSFSKAIPHIVKIEFLSDIESGIGTRFRETRLVKGKEVSNDLEVTEYAENDRVRLVADSHGTVWDSVFTVKSQRGRTELTLVMDARPYKLLPKVIYPLIRRMVEKSIEQDLDSVKTFCEMPPKPN